MTLDELHDALHGADRAQAAQLQLDMAKLEATLASVLDRLTKLEAPPAPVPVPVPPTPVRMRVAVPSYFYPGAKWDAMLAKVPAISISLINPANGPGTSASATYAAQVARAKATGIKVFGYVWTSYGDRPIADVKADIDRHVAWYGVHGIFLDEAANTLARLPYYLELCDYLRSRGLTSVLNPGTRTLVEYSSIADHVMVFESSVSAYRSRTSVAWEATVPASKLWHVIHSCPSAYVAEVVGLAKARNCGLLYVTDDVMTNPYDTLPSYIDSLCAEVAKS